MSRHGPESAKKELAFRHRSHFTGYPGQGIQDDTKLTVAELGNIYDQIDRSNQFPAASVICDGQWRDSDGLPWAPLTAFEVMRLDAVGEEIREHVREWMQGTFSRETLSAVLGFDLPVLHGRNFAYCVQTGPGIDAMERIWWAHLEPADRDACTWKQRLLVLDELYIH